MRFLILPAIVVLSGGAALAQEAPLQKVYACAAITGAEARLACFDAAVAGLKQAEAAGGVAVVSPEVIAQAQKDAFGKGPVTLADVTKPAASAAPVQPPELEKITVSITAFAKKADGRLRYTLDNGQVWEEFSDSLGKLKDLPAVAEIRRGMLNSFMMKVGDRPLVRVRRVN